MPIYCAKNLFRLCSKNSASGSEKARNRVSRNRRTLLLRREVQEKGQKYARLAKLFRKESQKRPTSYQRRAAKNKTICGYIGEEILDLKNISQSLLRTLR